MHRQYLLQGMIRTEIDVLAATSARLLIGGFFALSGANNMLDLSASTEQAAAAGVPAAGVMVFMVALLKIIAGIMIMIRLHSKIAAMCLVFYILASTLIFYNPLRWESYAYGEQIFYRNVAILGGLLFLYAHSRGMSLVTSGKPKRTTNT